MCSSDLREHGVPPCAPSRLPPTSILVPWSPQRAEEGPEMKAGTEGNRKAWCGGGCQLPVSRRGMEISRASLLPTHLSPEHHGQQPPLTSCIVREAGEPRGTRRQMSAPSPALHSEVRLEYHTVHRAQYFSSQTSGPANLAFSVFPISMNATSAPN